MVMRIKRYHKTAKLARAYILTLPSHFGLEVFRAGSGKYWVGTYLEWLNRY